MHLALPRPARPRTRSARATASPAGRLSARHLVVVAGVVASAGLLGGCGGNHDVLDPAGEGASTISVIAWIMIATSAVIAAVFLALLTWALVRPADRGPWSREGAVVVAGGIVLPLLVVLSLTGISLGALRSEASTGAERIEVIGHQYWWEVRYPDADVVTANVVHLAVGRPVDVELSTADVIHSFWVPALDGKIDLIPGRTNHLTLIPTEVGTFQGFCAEYCGLQHAQMRFEVQVTGAEDHQRWLTDQAAPAAEPSTDGQAAGRAAFLRLPCAACHTIRGTDADAQVGPDLTHLASRDQIGAGAADNTRGELGGWISNSQTIKPGNLMPPITMSPDELRDVLDYLESLR